MTTVADGLYQFGGMPVGYGARRFPGMWSGRTWFVDGTNGADGNPGNAPGRAFLTIQRAIDLAKKDDTIFVRPQLRNIKYNENLTSTSVTHEGVSIIGTGNGYGISTAQAVTIRGVLAVDSPCLNMLAANMNVENFHFRSRAAQTTGGLVAASNNTSGGTATGSSIVNCTFSQDMGAAAGAGVAQITVLLDSVEGALVQGCTFKDCRMGISVQSTASATIGVLLWNNFFLGSGANIAADIHYTDTTLIDISDNIFGTIVPAYGTFGGATYNKYVLYNGSSAVGQMARNYQGHSAVAAGTNNTLGGVISSGNFGLAGPWTS